MSALLAAVVACGGADGAAPTCPQPAWPPQHVAGQALFRVEWRMADDRGHVETWFEDLYLVPSQTFPRWRSRLYDEAGGHPAAERVARVRSLMPVAYWTLAEWVTVTGDPAGSTGGTACAPGAASR